MTVNRSFTILTLILMLAGPSLAAGEEHRFLAGASYGLAKLTHGAASIDDGSLSGVRVDDSDTAWKLFAGYRLDRHLTVELGLVDLANDVDGETTFNGTSDGGGKLFAAGPVSVDIDDPRALYAALSAGFPLGERLRAMAKLGVQTWRADVSTIDSAGASSRDESGTDLLVGLGLELGIGGRYRVRVEWERFADIAGDDIDVGSIGVAVGFGGSVG